MRWKKIQIPKIWNKEIPRGNLFIVNLNLNGNLFPLKGLKSKKLEVTPILKRQKEYR